jgi:hypothetical protein
MLKAPALVSVSRDGSRMFDRSANVIADARTGETIATIAAPNRARSEMLYDGRVAMTFMDARNVPHLRTFTRDGKPLHEVVFPKVVMIGIAGETENGKLIVSERWSTSFVVDLASGVVERTLTGIAGPLPRWSDDPRLIRYAADQEFVGVDAKEKLVVWKNEGRASARPLLPSR